MTQRMRPEIVLYIAASIDGFIADGNGSVAWLDPFADALPGFDEFLSSVDALAMGRVTFEFALRHPWTYGPRPTLVFAGRPLPDGPAGARVLPVRGHPGAAVDALPAATRRVWLVGGGETNAAFLESGLIDRIRLFVVPMVLGSGVRLFGRGVEAHAPRRFAARRTERFASGVVELEFTRS